ncbi:hypothetical protein GON03_15685 [Nocardioides sp. MAH-18]|uniref:Flagellar hook-length control protein-like C-terminal domain-containing protein n=1 Tax=Nocardioides agri TaxID=2682843 RepID=A0A6L6XVW5_9ACTN|nr:MULTISPECIES: flagellar hook-length control protein FliK [unclassified Nocardioides]MBA2955776.1 flagellar hook-length control protein FliK [Nocardioides sp. CGMCC 1.13656]MVQ50626.1 hypothetical protein [Nocardioides sp. MAH-18]
MNPTSLLSGLGAAVSAEPSLGGANGGGRASGSGTADVFMALVAGLLDGQGAGTPDGATQADGESAAGLPGATAATGAEGGTGAKDEQAAGADLADLQPDATDVVAVPMAVPTIVQPAVLTQVVPAAGRIDAGEPASAAPATSTTDAAAVDLPPAGPAAGADSQDAAGQDAGTPGSAPAPAAPSATPTPASSPTSTSASVTGATAVAAAAPAAPVDGSPAPAAHRVTEQVFPEVVRVSAGTADGGPRRVTVKLNPEALGEVRIVLTSRRGELEVSLAAGQDARRALVEGAPELHRLLESVGRADSRIVFRDLPGTTTVPSATPDGSPRTDVSTDLSGNAWSGAGRPGGEPAADRDGARQHPGSTNATDGTTSATPGSRPVTTAGRSHSGVDLTM